jgi:hypothetical protein
MYSQIITTDLDAVESFVREHAANLDGRCVHVRKKDGMILAEAFTPSDETT